MPKQSDKNCIGPSRSIEIERRKESLGLKVVPITPEMTNDVMDFIWEHFFQNEPLTASVDFKRGWFVDNLRYIPLLNKGDSFAALNREGELVGVYVGRQLSATDRAAKLIDFIGPYIYIYGAQIVGSATDLTRIIWLRKHLNYDPWTFMQEREINKIFEASIIAVDKKCRGKGIGEVLKYDAYKSLKESGCAYTYAMYTSNLSTAISKHFDEEVLSSALYQDLRDSSGRVLFPEHGEHTVISVRINKL